MKRSAFTLVELLVVVVVIALLAAILLPAINAAREYARQNQCLARQRDLAIAMITYDKENNGLPGYLNQLGNTPMRSWVVSILPMIGENKRYEFLMKQPPIDDEVKLAVVPLPALLCPSDKPEEDARLNYVVNCGPTVELLSGINGGEIAPHFTLFKDRRHTLILNGNGTPVPSDLLLSINKKVQIDEIPDGASNTILLTENVDANVWHRGSSGSATSVDQLRTNNPPNIFTRDSEAVKNFGFIWGTAAYALNSTTKGPRPSSKHPATVVAAFADGSARVINDNIALGEWLKAVCPDDAKAKLPTNSGGLGLSNL